MERRGEAAFSEKKICALFPYVLLFDAEAAAAPEAAPAAAALGVPGATPLNTTLMLELIALSRRGEKFSSTVEGRQGAEPSGGRGTPPVAVVATVAEEAPDSASLCCCFAASSAANAAAAAIASSGSCVAGKGLASSKSTRAMRAQQRTASGSSAPDLPSTTSALSKTTEERRERKAVRARLAKKA